jgi:membrane-bound serine protease (ClpP class)
VIAALLVLPAVSAFAQSDDRTIEVLEISGPLDDRVAGFVIDSIEAAGDTGNVEVVILQIDSRGAVASEDVLRQLADLVSGPPLPLVAWAGPAPARVQGGMAQIYSLAPLRAAAPEALIGAWYPTIAGSDSDFSLVEPGDPELVDRLLIAKADEPVPGLVDLVSNDTASVRQLGQLLDGMTVGGEVLTTIVPFTADDGTEGVTLLDTVIRQPGLWDQFLRLASTPEATFFFLAAGLTIAAFEFYAIGPGIASGVAAISLLIAGYGLAVLPFKWWALILTLGSVLLMSISYQLGGVLLLTWLGLIGLTIGGFALGDTGPQIQAGIPGVLMTVAGVAFFFLLAMPTVARSRFSTQTIGREGLIGRRGMAVSALTPDGEVEVEGARWRATSHREAGISQGDAVDVVGVDGWYLEVEPAAEDS